MGDSELRLGGWKSDIGGWRGDLKGEMVGLGMMMVV